MRRTKELPRKIRNLSGYCLSGLALAGITMCKGAFDVKTKLLSWLLTLSLLMTMLPTAAFAADGESTETGDSTPPEAAIYLDQQHGADDNDGLSKTTAVKTIEKANELANEKNINDICLSSFYKVTGTETWDLGGKTLHRYGLGGYMIELVDASASLTLSNIVIDGAECTVDAAHAAETDSIIKAAPAASPG